MTGIILVYCTCFLFPSFRSLSSCFPGYLFILITSNNWMHRRYRRGSKSLYHFTFFQRYAIDNILLFILLLYLRRALSTYCEIKKSFFLHYQPPLFLNWPQISEEFLCLNVFLLSRIHAFKELFVLQNFFFSSFSFWLAKCLSAICNPLQLTLF